MENFTENEFSSLFKSEEDIAKRLKLTQTAYESHHQDVNNVIEDVLLITLNQSSTSKAFLHILKKTYPDQCLLNEHMLDAAIFLRILYSDTFINIVTTEELNQHVFLYTSFSRIRQLEEKGIFTENLQTVNKALTKAICKAALAPTTLNRIKSENDDLYQKESTQERLWKICKNGSFYEMIDFLEIVAESADKNQSSDLGEFLEPFFDMITKDVTEIKLSKLDEYNDIFAMVNYIAAKPTLSKLMVLMSVPKDPTFGKSWESTLLGSLFSISITNKNDYFLRNPKRITIADYKINEQNAWCNVRRLRVHLFDIFENLLRAGKDSKEEILSWFGQCLTANAGRTSEMAKYGGLDHIHSNTGMFINIGYILMQLSLKVFAKNQNQKIEHINSWHMLQVNGILNEFGKETPIVAVSATKTEVKKTYEQFKFSNDIYYMAQISLNIGINQAHVEFDSINKSLTELHTCEKTLKKHEQDGINVYFHKTVMGDEGPLQRSYVIKNEQELSKHMNEYCKRKYCLRTELYELHLRENLNDFLNLTSKWLTQKCVKFSDKLKKLVPQDDFALQFMEEYGIEHNKQTDNISSDLNVIPEFILDSLYYFLKLENFPLLYGKYKEKIFSKEFQENILQLFVLLMSADYIKNPHWKAKFAEGISLLLPEENRKNVSRSAALLQPSSDVTLLQPMSVETANSIFDNLENKKDVVEALLRVYASLEVAGESLMFEQKFLYRYPINYVLMYFLTLDDYRKIIADIAQEAHENMNNQNAPIFLKFVDGMLNDGTWLIDESLSKMKSIRKAEELIASEQFKQMSKEEKTRVIADFNYYKKLTINMNLLSSDVLRILEALSKLTVKVFTHIDIVDKLVAMLNYFLENLTGKDRKQYKVQDPISVAFYPVELLLSIKNIYCSFASERSFLIAIPQDGRSYHPELLKEAANILKKHEDMDNFLNFIRDVILASVDVEKEANFYADAPDEFIDPLISTMMKDPVILPSSKQTVDRSTIAKHLLSNETDPFNRQPLSLGEVIPNKELKEKILKWEKMKKGIVTKDEPNTENNEDEGNKSIMSNVSSDKTNQEDILSSDNQEKTKSVTGGHSLGGDKLKPRIRKDMKIIIADCPEDIFYHFDEADMTLFHVVIRGPPDTPYEGGYFYFRLHCPPNYPASPPKVEFLTTDGGRVRFNPNLYRDGKVCLSILGTMNGPGWTPALNMLQVLMTIQSILVDNAFFNASMDITGTDEQKNLNSEEYNVTITHETIRVAFLGMIKSPPPCLPESLHVKVKEDAKNYICHHMKSVEKYYSRSGSDMLVTYSEFGGKFDWKTLKSELNTLSL